MQLTTTCKLEKLDNVVELFHAANSLLSFSKLPKGTPKRQRNTLNKDSNPDDVAVVTPEKSANASGTNKSQPKQSTTTAVVTPEMK